MIKRIVVGVLLAGLIGILVAGAIVRTVDKTGNVAEARGAGQGRGEERLGSTAPASSQEGGGYGQGGSQEGGDYGQGGGQGRNAGGGQGQSGAGAAEPQQWEVVQGTVVESPADDADLVIETDNGEQVTIGTGPGYAAEQGFSLEVGEEIKVDGYWEDGEFKAARLTQVRDGQTLSLRDDYGRPAWSGRGRNAGTSGGAAAPGTGNGTVSGTSQRGSGTPQAEVEEWLTIQGTVTGTDSDALLVETADGQQVVVENRGWWFAQEQGFSTQVGNQVTLTGFYDGDQLEVGQISDGSNGQTVQIRDESGRPLWAGRGRQGG